MLFKSQEVQCRPEDIARVLARIEPRVLNGTSICNFLTHSLPDVVLNYGASAIRKIWAEAGSLYIDVETLDTKMGAAATMLLSLGTATFRAIVSETEGKILIVIDADPDVTNKWVTDSGWQASSG